jgi:hypothetical protein
MPYTKTGPFTNGAAPGMSAAFLNEVERFLHEEVSETKQVAVQTWYSASDVTLPVDQTSYDHVYTACTLPSAWDLMDVVFYGYYEVGVNYCEGFRFYVALQNNDTGAAIQPTALYQMIRASSTSSARRYGSFLAHGFALGVSYPGLTTRWRFTHNYTHTPNGVTALSTNRFLVAIKYRRG